MLGALQWEVNESKGYSGILIPGAQAWLAGVWWPHPGSSPEPDRFLPGNNASRCVDLVRSGQTRSPSSALHRRSGTREEVSGPCGPGEVSAALPGDQESERRAVPSP